MSAPTMNHSSHMHHQEQQQQQQTDETLHTHSNSDNASPTTLTRSDSTSTVILEEEETPSCRRNRRPPAVTQPPSILQNLSFQLRSLLKTSGLFNKDWEATDKWDEMFASGNSFALQRLLSDAGVNDVNIDWNELLKTDSTRPLDSRTLSEFLRLESFDQLMASMANNPNLPANPPANPCSSSSFSAMRPLSPELTTNHLLPSQSKLETSDHYLCTPINSFALPTSTTNSEQNALNAFEHDHAFLSKRTSPSPPPTTTTTTTTTTESKRTRRRGGERATSSRLRSRAIATSTTTETTTSAKSKRTRLVNRAMDIETSDDLSYYLERRRKNNEASKMSRAARKQKFGDMDRRCQEYERVNAELRMKISTLERVTASLKSGLVNNFQRKPGV